MLIKSTISIMAVFGCFLIPTFKATRTTFDGQVFSLSKQIQDTMAYDPRLKGQPIAVGEFLGKGEATGTNYGLRIEQTLKDSLRELLDAQGRFTLTGSYLFINSQNPDTPDAKVLVITAQIRDDRGRDVKPFSVEVNDSDEIAQVLGLTAAFPKKWNFNFQDRNKELQQAKDKPAFTAIDTYRVSAVGAPDLSMGILKKGTLNATTTPVSPENIKGEAFIKMDPGDYYVIELVNSNTIDVVATVTVDGLDVANTFATDEDPDGKPIHWSGYLLPAGQSMIIRGWLNSIGQKAKSNVFTARVPQPGQQPVVALNRSRLSVITVQFREATEPDKVLSPRSQRGEAGMTVLLENLEAKTVHIDANVLSTVSIRYTR